jgi:hypothetical protein
MRYHFGVENAEDGNAMTDRKRELKQAYKEMKTEAGVYQIRNTVNGKALVVVTSNLKTMQGKQFQLQMGSHMNRQLQADWKQFGEDAFVFEVLEVLEDKDEGALARQESLKHLEQKWLDKLQPFGDRGYNQPPRQA